MRMTINCDGSRIVVARGQMLALPDADGSRVTCLTGALWITQDRDRDDMVLLGGQSMRISRDGTTLIYGCSESELRICPPQGDDPVAPAAGAGVVSSWLSAWRGR